THVHSARTTLLLDDSPRKAHLQPYNHVCIREYDASLRRADLEVLHAAREEERARKEDEEERARKEDGEQRARTRDDEAGTYDATLLAVVGVLDAVRAESNVAGWIRRGGLWGPRRGEIGGGTGDLAGKMWFEDARVMEYWAQRGRAALERLGIPVEHGVES
ncbi:hypothetical protein GLOTRDRAFT_45955, partial [Gloeophyllum trabeum ATCC 11539]